jgi:serine/threonine protein phosphatase PrpC
MAFRVQCDGVSHAGRRPRNEDALFVNNESGVFAVADGMGGYEGGEVASHIAINTLRNFFADLAALDEDDAATEPVGSDDIDAELARRLDRAVLEAHREVVAARRGRHAQMGTTLSTLVLRHGKAYIGHVGDSRVYRLRGGQLTQLTKDHSLYNELLMDATQGELPPLRDFPFRNVITQALGMKGQPTTELFAEPVEAGDVFLLCTDGLCEDLPEYHMQAVLGALPPEEACRELVDDAYQWGSRDNITAVVVKVLAQ